MDVSGWVKLSEKWWFKNADWKGGYLGWCGGVRMEPRSTEEKESEADQGLMRSFMR
jgi:hypothetical protein